MCGTSNDDNTSCLAAFGPIANCPKPRLGGGEKICPKSKLGAGSIRALKMRIETKTKLLNKWCGTSNTNDVICVSLPLGLLAMPKSKWGSDVFGIWFVVPFVQKHCVNTVECTNDTSSLEIQ